jgi:cytoskeletal protein RodZ
MDSKEAAMSYQDPLNPMPPRPSEVDPLPPQQPGSNPPRYQSVDGPWNSGTIASAVIAVLVVVGLIVWAASTNDQQTTSKPPAQTTGQNTK